MPVTPVRQSLRIFQGSTLQHRWVYQDEAGDPIDLTDYKARLQVRDEWYSTTNHIDATSENGLLIINAPEGTIDLLVSATETEDLDFDSANFDLELIHPDEVTVDKLAYGTVKLVREVTR